MISGTIHGIGTTGIFFFFLCSCKSERERKKKIEIEWVRPVQRKKNEIKKKNGKLTFVLKYTHE